MVIVYSIIVLFSIGWTIPVVIYFLQNQNGSQSNKEELPMSHKAKFNSTKQRAKEVFHLDYLRVYHEVLKHEDVLDIDLDVIYTAVVQTLRSKIGKTKTDGVPDPIEIEILVKEVMDKLVVGK